MTLTYRTVGKITGAHGIQGAVVVRPFEFEVPWLKTVQTFYAETPQGEQHLQVRQIKKQGEKVIVWFEQINTRNDAEGLKGLILKLPSSDLPPLAEDEYYIDDLVGLTVQSMDSGTIWGTVKEVLSATAGEYLEVHQDNKSQPVLIPFQSIFIPRVDQASRTIYVQGLDSLFE